MYTIRFASMATFAVISVIAQATTAAMPLGSEFTYQGKLNLADSPVNDTADFEFTLWDQDSAGTMIGSVVAVDNVLVVDGAFTVELNFGVDAFNGEVRWLEIAVRSPAGAGDYSTLSPRQPLTATPYALALPALRTETDGERPNVIGGHVDNNVTPGIEGATIGGGGLAGFPNSVTGFHGTVGGGAANTAAIVATVSGGSGNTATGSRSTVSGGQDNTAGGEYATVAGGELNTANGEYAAVGGGDSNAANGNDATVGGGSGNSAGGNWSTVPGGRDNEASGTYSFAVGRHAKALHNGAFVLADNTDAEFASTADKQFLIRAGGGVGINKTNPVTELDVSGTVTATAFAGDGSGLTGISGDNLGNHTATENVALGSHWLSGDGEDEGIVVDDIGNVGIGTDEPASALHIQNGFFTISHDAFAPKIVLVDDEDGSDWTIRHQRSGNDLQFLESDTVLAELSSEGQFTAQGVVLDGNYLSGDGDNEGVFVDEDGNVGIGTTDPGSALHVGERIRMGSETGTTAAASHGLGSDYRGIVTRRVISNSRTDGNVVARTDDLRLERDGTDGGLKISWDANPRPYQMVTGTIVTKSGNTITQVPIYEIIGFPDTAGSFQLNDDTAVFVHIIFGNQFNGDHHTEVTLFRIHNDYWWMGNVHSTWDQ